MWLLERAASEGCLRNPPLQPTRKVGDFGDATTAGEENFSYDERLWAGLSIISRAYSPPNAAPVSPTAMPAMDRLCMQLGMVKQNRQCNVGVAHPLNNQ